MKQKGDQPSTSADMTSILSAMEGLSVEDKVTKLAKRLAESEELNGKLKEKANLADKLQKANAGLEKKLEKANHILVRTEEAKCKLEELCRELQKYNKQVREDCQTKVRLMETERQGSVEQLKGTLKDIEKSMSAGRERSDQMAQDNLKLADKLQLLGKEYEERLLSIEEQYRIKDKYWDEFSKTKEIEMKLYQAKLEAAQCTVQKLDLEKEELARSLIDGTGRVGQAIENEQKLREQVKQYADRYSQLTESISQSNAAFEKFSKEIERVSTNLRKTESEANKWKNKYDAATRNVLVLTMAKKELEDQSVVSAKKLAQLEQLCRALSGRKGEEEQPTASDDTA